MTTPLPSRLRESAKALRGLSPCSEHSYELLDVVAWNIAAELTEAADALEAGPWMPIETAPKDGTAVMLGNSGGAWIGRFMQFAQSGYRFDDPWRSLMLNHYHIPYEHRYKAPTHWMPLPAAPAAQVAQEGGAWQRMGAAMRKSMLIAATLALASHTLAGADTIRPTTAPAPAPVPAPKRGKLTKAEKKAAKRARTRGVEGTKNG